MSISLYTYAELTAIADAAVKSNLPDLDPTIPGSFIRALMASAATLTFASQRNIQSALDDFFPQTGSGEFLDFWGGINALTRIPGTVAGGNISITGTLATSIPAGTIFASSAGEKYTSTTTADVAAQTGSVSLSGNGTTVTATTSVSHGLVDNLLVDITGASDTDFNGTDLVVDVLDEYTFTYDATTAVATDSGSYSSEFANIPLVSDIVGSDQNLSAGASMTLVSTVSGITYGTEGIVNGDGITAGTDLETDDTYRSRILLANSIDPGIFTSAQIRSDARTIPTATRVFVTTPSIDYTTDGTDVSARSITSITQTSGVATALITDTSNLYEGSTVTIAGADDDLYNGDVTIISLTDNTSFTFAVDSSATSPDTGTLTVSLDKLKNTPQPGRCYVFVLDDNNVPPSPSSLTLTNVETAILEDLPAHTVSDDVIVSSPFFESVDITITDLSPNTTTMQTALRTNLSAFFEDSAEFAEDIQINKLISSIQNTQNLETGDYVESFTLTTPSANVSVGNGTIGILGTVTFA